jgi:cell wall-associated NlpC family hydrolase
MSVSLSSARRFVLLVSVLIVSAVCLPSSVAAHAAPQTEAQKIVSIAQQQLGDRYSFSATGPTSFDCSGLVYFVYKQAGLLDRIGGARRTVAGYHNWFNNHGTVSHSLADAHVGDVLIWGANHHTGIYVGGGYAISALINPWGVTRHPVLRYIHMQLTAVLHVNLQR